MSLRMRLANVAGTGAHSGVGTAVVFTGPATDAKEYRNLIRQIKDLRRSYPELVIVLSTYADADASILSEAERLDVVVGFAGDVGPTDCPFGGRGESNFLRQVHSTAFGIELAEKEGVRACLRVRTDQSVRATGLFEGLEQLAVAFPDPETQASRLWVTSYNSFEYPPARPSDMLQYGTVSQIAQYWSRCSLADLSSSLDELDRSGLLPSSYAVPESWLAVRYARSRFPSAGTFGDLCRLMWSHCFGIVDADMIHFRWNKRPVPFSGPYELDFFPIGDSRYVHMDTWSWLLQLGK